MTPVGTRPKPCVTAFIHRWQGSAVVYELVQYFFLRIFTISQRMMYRAGGWSWLCSTVLVFVCHSAIKVATRPFNTNHGSGSKLPTVAYLFLFGATPRPYKNTTVKRRKSTHAIRNARGPPCSRPHRHNRHISVISLPVFIDQWPALTTSPISKKKSSSKLSKPNCPLNNPRRNTMIPPPTCGDFCFHAVRGSTSSTSGGHSQSTRLAVVTITRSVCPE